MYTFLEYQMAYNNDFVCSDDDTADERLQPFQSYNTKYVHIFVYLLSFIFKKLSWHKYSSILKLNNSCIQLNMLYNDTI